MIIAIEGVDGVGKTSVAKRLAEKLGFVYVERPFSKVFSSDQLEKYMEIKKGLNLLQDRSLLAWFYGLNVLFGRFFLIGKMLYTIVFLYRIFLGF